MITKNFFVILAGIVAISLAWAASARASNMIGVDFYKGSSANQSPATTDVVGPYAASGWYNQIDPSTVPGGAFTLSDNTGTPTSAQFSFKQGGNTLSGYQIYNSGYGASGAPNAGLTADQQLYNGAISASATGTSQSGAGWSQEVVLTNIPYANYSVYLLVNAARVAGDTTHIVGSVQNFDGNSSGNPGTTYYLQDSNQVNAQIPPTLGYAQATGTTFGTATVGANYVLFSGLTDASEAFDLVNATPFGQPYSNDVTLGAIEIVDTSPAPAPEPATLSMLGTVGGVLLFRRRRLAC